MLQHQVDPLRNELVLVLCGGQALHLLVGHRQEFAVDHLVGEMGLRFE